MAMIFFLTDDKQPGHSRMVARPALSALALSAILSLSDAAPREPKCYKYRNSRECRRHGSGFHYERIRIERKAGEGQGQYIGTTLDGDLYLAF